MCDKELLIGYLYGELPPVQREAFDRHLASCADCRGDVGGLRETRTTLQSWTPPEPDLGFQIVRSPERAATGAGRWWKVSPVWALAAAAMLVGAISAGVANLEITAGPAGLSVRTGRGRPAEVNAQAAGVSDAAVADLRTKVAALQAQIAAVRERSSAPTLIAAPVSSRMSDAELVRLVRQLIEQSEERQQGVLARQILQVNRDVETARRMDLDRLGRGMDQIQRTTVDTYQRQKALEDHFLRVGVQR
jgi:anti-sigma factor RsiW